VLIRIDGLETFYRQEGQGAPVVLLHGWGTSSESLAGVAACLAPGFRVVSVDLPGFGWSQAPAAAWGTADYADHVRRFLDEIGIATAAFLGHSFGGRIAIHVASHAPRRVSRLILVASAGVRPKRGPRYYFRVTTAKVLRRLLALPGLEGVGGRLLSRWQARVGSRDYLAAGRLRPTLVKVVNEDLTPLLAAVQAPTLLVWGDRDQEVRRPAVDVMAATIPRSRLAVFPGAGHFPFQDEPETFCRVAMEFLHTERWAATASGEARR
jgi:pimeloyl-ACP methyl ester carboxylesterase